MGNIRLMFLSKRRLNDTKLLRVSRSDSAYLYFQDEYTSELSKDNKGNFFVNCEKEKLLKVRRYLFSRIIERGSSQYSYWRNEYRQNALMKDLYGNILLSDDAYNMVENNVLYKR